MKRGFCRGGMQTSGVAIFTVVVLAVVGIVLLEVGAVRGIEVGRENADGSQAAVGRVVAAQTEWQSFDNRAAVPAAGDVALDTTKIDYASAETLYNTGHYAEAAEAFSAYTRQQPGNLWGQYMFGLSAWKAGDLVQAIVALRTAIEIDSEHVKSRVNLARVLLDAGRPWEALEAIKDVVMLDADAPGVQRVLGRCYHENDEFADAEIAYKQAIGLDAQDVWALNNLGLLYIEQQRYEEGLYALASAALLRDDIAEVQNNLGVALENTGHPLAATQAYARALELDSAYEKARTSLERVQLVAESVDDEDVDLRQLAAQFRLEDVDQPRAEEPLGLAPAVTPAGDGSGMHSDAVR
jgi:tetratricopeptide (TPR) repeat protein